ncbi:DUF4870 domain-containing protein [Granulicella arctica]|uniref:Putative membrane protein n=1 Tax=Granulicella arctica TaxID=940613 RepID=A0A7Y9PLR7_9BACT|nr:DUF4870 domain-containing protein [Granulicella arctica]NYF81378.1 putative membrane protein [Granulicella arctica]
MSEQIPPQQPPYTNVPYSDAPPPAGPAFYPQAGYPPAAPSSGLSDNSAAALAYLTIIPAIIFLIIEPYNKIPLVRFHSIQCLALGVVSFALQVGLTILSIFLHFIPLVGILFSLIHLAVFLVIFVAWLMAIIKASKGEWFKLPIIGDFAEKQARS